MKNEDVPVLSFADLLELDEVIEQLREFSEFAERPGVASELLQDNPFSSLLRRLLAQEHWQRQESERLHPGAFDRSYLADEYAAIAFLLNELKHFPWKLPGKLDVLTLRLHRLLILGNLTEDELRKTLAEHAEAVEAAARLRPMAEHGQKFQGGKPNSGGPIRKAIARLLAKNPALTNPELWAEIKRKPPRGFEVIDSGRSKFIDGPPQSKGMEYRRFCNVCAEERKKLVAKITG